MVTLSNTRIIRDQYIPRGGQFSPDFVKIETTNIGTELIEGEILIRNLYLAIEPCS